jgi:short-subunit dehydrogenase
MSQQQGTENGWAVITGASSGLGAIFAEQLAKRGHSLVLAGRDQPRLTAVRQRVAQIAPHTDVQLVVADLGTEAGLTALMAQLNGRLINVLVNNAGFGTYGPLSQADARREHDMIAVNVDALMRLTHAVLPGMTARGAGGILNVASTAAFQPAPYQAVYGASKAFVLSFSEALWAEVRGAGVTVTALCPGPTRTGFVDALGSDVSHTAVYGHLAAPEPRSAAVQVLYGTFWYTGFLAARSLGQRMLSRRPRVAVARADGLQLKLREPNPSAATMRPRRQPRRDSGAPPTYRVLRRGAESCE